jgi:hypothetical protein
MKALALFGLALAGCLIAACSPSATPIAHQVTSPSPTALAPGTCDTAHRCLALVTLRGSENFVVRDITDINHPMTLGNLGSNRATFVSAAALEYTLNGSLVTTPLSGSPVTPVPGVPKGASPQWSPDRSEGVYLTERGSYETGDPQIDVHLWRSGIDRVVGTTPGLGMGDCQTISNCTMTNWLDSRLAFSPDGRFFSFVAQGFGPSFIYVWSSDGTLLKSDKTKPTTMSIWSAQNLYFRDGGGVEAWHDGAISKFLPGVFWIKPNASPAGGMVVYTVRGPGGWGHIYLVETATGKARELKAQRTDAVFLTSRYVWYRGERACVAADACGPNPPFHPENGKTYVYDLQTGAEYSSIITSVIDVWPHAA